MRFWHVRRPGLKTSLQGSQAPASSQLRFTHTNALDAATSRRMHQFLFNLSLFPWGNYLLATALTQGWRVGCALKTSDGLCFSKVCFLIPGAILE